jgi:hypothetical protein
MQLYENVKRHSTHLGYSFVVTGNDDLGKKMTSYTKDQKVFVFKTIHFSRGAFVAMERQHLRVFSVVLTLMRDEYGALMKKILSRGNQNAWKLI